MYNTLEIYKGGREQCDGYSDELARATYNGYGMRKFLRDRSTEVGGKFYSCPLIRLPEIYLNIAEAMNELGKATDKDEFGRDAYDYVNLVRERVKMPALTSQKAAPGLPLREAILHERAVEMGFEEVRYFDLTRWKRDDLFKTPIERLFIQWGFSQVFPSKTLCAHVTTWNRGTSIKFRTDVAMMCKLGFDIKL